MADVILTALNAKYAHAAFGLRYLMANLPSAVRGRAEVMEFDIGQRPTDVLEAILAEGPRIVGVGVYIWNATQSLQLVAELKRVRPDVTVVLGGPEVSHETGEQEIVTLADYVITGEADLTFADLCENLLAGRRPLLKVIAAEVPGFGGEANEGAGAGGNERVSVPGLRREQTQTITRGEPGGSDAGVPLETSLTPNLPVEGLGPADVAPDNAAAAPSTSSPPRRRIALPYSLYTDEDIARRVIYVEASRGCPFRCEFCLSSLDVPVRNVPLGPFLAEMGRLLDRGANRFKFVDRTFNLNLGVSLPILEFFLGRYRPGLFLHFEMIPDRLPDALRGPIRQFPPGALQFEVGIQTYDRDTGARISRRQDYEKLDANLRFLREETGVHVHADLIAGLPGEGLESFAAGFDRLVALRPQEIQVGILKRLRGTPIVRHDTEWGMVYSPSPPYEVLRTSRMDFPTLQRVRRFSRYWDLLANSGNFGETLPLVWHGVTPDGEGPDGQRPSPFRSFLRLTDRLYEKAGRNHGIALHHLAEYLFRYLADEVRHDPRAVAKALWRDYRQGGRRDGPDFLRPYVDESDLRAARRVVGVRDGRLPSRQARHTGGRASEAFPKSGTT